MVVCAQRSDIVEFIDRDALWSWLAASHDTHPGAWVRLRKSGGPSVCWLRGGATVTIKVPR